MKKLLIGLLLGLIIGLSISQIIPDVTIYEDGSFNGCLPGALCERDCFINDCN